jgi:hypothetical protein
MIYSPYLRSPYVFVYFFLLAVSFLCFQQGDLIHTFKSSYAYLNGHIWDFYDYNKPIMGFNDYLPILYLIFAIWNLPLLWLGLIPAPNEFATIDLSIQLLWSKLLLALFFAAAAWVLAKIAKIVIDRGEVIKAQPVVLLFLTAPLAIFPVFVFGQYDVIGVFFTLLGVYFYLQRKLYWFAFCFAIAISFKYFALAVYLPLILMVEKRPLVIVKWVLLGLLIVLVQHIAYWHNEAFTGQIFKLIQLKIAGDQGSNLSWKMPTPYLMALYGVGCLYLYFKSYPTESRWIRDVVFVPLLAYGLMFGSVLWHPQWMVIATPFYALAYLFIRNIKLFVLVDLLAMLAFIWLCVNIWPKNVDVTMLNYGILQTLFPPDLIGGASLLPRILVRPMRLFFYFYFLFPLFLLMWEQWRPRPILVSSLSPTLLWTRFLVGNGLFLVLATLCLLLTIASPMR